MYPYMKYSRKKEKSAQLVYSGKSGCRINRANIIGMMNKKNPPRRSHNSANLEINRPPVSPFNQRNMGKEIMENANKKPKNQR